MDKISRTKALEACLAITAGFIFLFLLFRNEIFLFVALGTGLTGLLIKPLARIIAYGWFKLAEALSFIVSKILLGSIFFVILFPLSLFYRMANRDKLRIKHPGESTWTRRDHLYEGKDLEEIW